MIANFFTETLAFGYNTHPDGSYVVMTDCPERQQAADSIHAGIRETLAQATYQNRTDDASPSDHSQPNTIARCNLSTHSGNSAL